jgi:hypothetical protein
LQPAFTIALIISSLSLAGPIVAKILVFLSIFSPLNLKFIAALGEILRKILKFLNFKIR